MKIELTHTSRRPPWPAWALGLVLLWLALGAAAVWLAARTGQTVQLCLFKRLTGTACPTCGLTRGALSLLQGEIAAAWLYNPLLFSIIAIFFGRTVVRAISARSVRMQFSPRERVIGWILAVTVGLANWAYVALCPG